MLEMTNQLMKLRVLLMILLYLIPLVVLHKVQDPLKVHLYPPKVQKDLQAINQVTNKVINQVFHLRSHPKRNLSLNLNLNLKNKKNNRIVMKVL